LVKENIFCNVVKITFGHFIRTCEFIQTFKISKQKKTKTEAFKAEILHLLCLFEQRTRNFNFKNQNQLGKYSDNKISS